MPIYEYTCKSCGKDFELLVRSDTAINCTFCSSNKVKKKFSVFSVSKTINTVPSCSQVCHGGFEKGACGSGGCCHGH